MNLYHVQDDSLPWPDLTERLDYDFKFESDESSLSDALFERRVAGDSDGSDASASYQTSEMGDVESLSFGAYADYGAVKLESVDEWNGDACDSGSNACDSGCSSAPSVSDAPAVFKFVDESEQFEKKKNRETEYGDVENVRTRIKRRNNRPNKVESKSNNDTRRMRNTMAARRYRERQRSDLEVLDARIRQVEEELRSAKLEIKWWKMESTKWKEEAQRQQEFSE